MSIPIRQPLPWGMVLVPTEVERQSIKRQKQSILEELNIKDLYVFAMPKRGQTEGLSNILCKATDQEWSKKHNV